MAKMWQGFTSGETNELADKFNSSINIDKRMYKEDIKGSLIHALMLKNQNIITEDDCNKITEGLSSILEDIENGKLMISEAAEDIHMFIEEELTKRIGVQGKKLHTARSRNDQVALDLRMYLKNECDATLSLLDDLISVLVSAAEKYSDTIMPGYTHLQRAQPILFSQQLLCYTNMFIRDKGRIEDAKKRMNLSPIGSCALAGTTFETDRKFEAENLGFDSYTQNSIDSVSDRDFCVELLSALSIIMMHLSRFSEELIIYSTIEFGFITFSDDFTTGSSIMPQKKNSDMCELIRGKTGRVYGDLISTLTMLKGLPLAYNKDMQEDKESIFDAFDTAKLCLAIMSPMIESMTVHKDKMKEAAKKGFINATDLADYLTKKGVPFREAYKTTGEIVHLCSEKNISLEELSLEEYKNFNSLFEDDLYNEIDLLNCVNKRNSLGGTSQTSVNEQIKYIKENYLND